MEILPETMRPLKVVETGKVAIHDVPLPTLRDEYVLVKVRTVALNPTDWYVTYSALEKN
jgi:NADPH:quinone reductase-like Zn-dependent oxidoreductase